MALKLLVVVAVAPVLLAYLLACFRDPLRFALPPYAIVIPFSSSLSIGLPGPFASLSSMLGLLLGVTLLAQLVTTRRSSPQLPLVVPIWLAFLALAGLSLFWSVNASATAASFAILASLVLLFVALAVAHFDRIALTRFENAIILGGVLVVCYGLAQLLFLGGLPAPDGRAARFGNDLLGANNQAASLLLPFAVAAGRTVAGPALRRSAHAVASMLLLLGIVMTGSRGGLLAAVVVVAAVVLLSPRRRGALLAVGSAVALLAVIFVFTPDDLGQRQLGDVTSSGRTDIWAVGLHACREYCLVGAGWGGFPTVYERDLAEVPEARVQERGTAFEPHNIWLLAAVEAGVAGLLLVALGLGTGLVDALRLPATMRGPPAAALLGTLVSSLFLSNLEFKFFWAVLAYIAISRTVVASGQAPLPALAGMPSVGEVR